MGGSGITIVDTVLGLATGAMGAMNKPKAPSSDAAARMEAERQAREEEQRQEEAEARRRKRDQVLEARSAEKSAKARGAEQSLLAGGGAGLADQASVARAQLKQKLGE